MRRRRRRRLHPIGHADRTPDDNTDAVRNSHGTERRDGI
jgi:hypothetical protein